MSQYTIVKSVIQDLFIKLIQKSPTSELYVDGIHFCVRIMAHSDVDDKQVYTFVHLILVHPYSVFMCESDSSSMPEPRRFENTSNHDSCWSSDGLNKIPHIGFRIWDEVHKGSPNAPATKDVGIEYNMTPLLQSVFRYVRVKHEAVDPLDTYRRRLVSINVVNKEV